MNSKTKGLSLILLAIGFLQFLQATPDSVPHPRILLRADEFDDWRARYNSPPWNNFTYASWNINPTWQRPHLTKIDHAILGYILDNDSQSPFQADYRREIIESIDQFYTASWGFPSITTVHAEFVGYSHNVVYCILALDLIYNDPNLSTADRNRLYSRIEEMVTYYRDNYQSRAWRLAPYSIFTLWSYFSGNTAQFAIDIEDYRGRLFDLQLNEDGSWTSCPGYMGARMSGIKAGKSATALMMGRLGELSFYDNPKMNGFSEWITAFWLTPFGAAQKFGDTIGSTPFQLDTYTTIGQLGYFGQEWAEKGKWLMVRNGVDFFRTGYNSNSAITYSSIDPNYESHQITMPTSSLMKNYGAALWGRNDSTEALLGALNSFERGNNKVIFEHSQEGTNSIVICGYGEHLLMNPGINYNNNSQTPAGERWSVAHLQNVALIGNQSRHQGNIGAGLTNGLTGGSVEFGRTSSGSAMNNGIHHRSLFKVHADPGQTNGYFFLFDEIAPNNPSDSARILLHPNATTVSTVSNNAEYRSNINGTVQSDSDGTEAINIFYATSPSAVSKQTGYFAESSVITAQYLDAAFETDADGEARVLTVIFPEDATHSKASFSRIAGGTTVDHGGNVIDTILESDGASVITRNNISYRGHVAHYRSENGSTSSYLISRGRSFDDGQTQRMGFNSDSEISLQMDAETGFIETNGANVVFYHPGLSGVLINGSLANTIPVSGGLQATVPAGRHAITLETNGPADSSFTLGNPNDPGNADGWNSNIIINKGDTYTNTSGQNEQILIEQFSFHSDGPGGSPLTPFLVRINGDNDFTVLAIGTTRTSTTYSAGANDLAFQDNYDPILNLAPGETIATGFLDSYADGSGSTGSVISFSTGTSSDQIWYSGGPNNTDSASISVGNSPSPGAQTITTLSRDYSFSISLRIPTRALGNSSETAATPDEWNSNMIINEADTYTNDLATNQLINIERFRFYAQELANPVTPFIVKVNGDNDFTVVAIGTTRTSTNYTLGTNDLPFDDSLIPTITLAPGESIATGFLDAFADGSGSQIGAVIPYDEDQPQDEVWHTGNTGSGSVSLGVAPVAGSNTVTTLTRNYHYSIQLTFPNDLAPLISSTLATSGSQGEVFSYQLTAENFPTSFSATNLPIGLNIDPTTGLISGNIAPGTYVIGLSATNAIGTDSVQLTANILTGYQAAVETNYPSLGAPLDDDDGDGMPNLAEIALANQDPLQGDSYGYMTMTEFNDFLEITMNKSGVAGFDYTIEGSPSLLNGTWSENLITIQSEDLNTLTVRYDKSRGTSYFFRGRIEQTNAPTP